ncbi:Arm DNA-binding domain-containing protein [Paraburkholderia sp. LEh10]|uniref:Arm DNA-binding domain-containing protein n=1 Tax=Paraburkholderia sp. LEh10 TaxID=2821353 RepID=UPI00391846EF
MYFKDRFAGKEKGLVRGVYPDEPLADARKRRDDARENLAANVDPGEAMKADNAPPAGPHRISFHRPRRSDWD